MSTLFRWNTIINAVLFQITWFACVIGSAKGMLWPAIVSCAALAVYQLQAKNRAATDLKLIVISLGLGLLVDSLWIQLGMVEFTDQRPFSGIAPGWILLLWVGFAMTVNHSLSWINTHALLPATLGAIGGPLSYLAGQRLGAVSFEGDSTLLLVCVGISWAVALTVLAQAARPKAQQRLAE